MPRLLPATGAVCLGFLLGLMLAPMVFGTEPGSAGPSNSGGTGAASQLMTAGEDMPSADSTPSSVTPSANKESPSPQESATEEEKTRAEKADERAGVRDREVPDSADGDLDIVSGGQDAPDPDADRTVSVRVEVEAGLPVDGEAFAEFALETLNDSRSWSADGALSFARTDGEAEFRLILVSPEKVNDLCAPLRTLGRYSCANEGRAVINALRYAQATEEFLDAGGSHTLYRQYVVNHEVGHLLGHDHQPCPGEGESAPVMQQQTISLNGCRPTGWPHPEKK